MKKHRAPSPLGGPFLRRITLNAEEVDRTRYPFNIPAFARGIDIELTANVTFFVGENGSGKSTLLEAIATRCGFDPEGGSRDHRFSVESKVSELGRALALSWLPKVSDGFFMRAESFYNFATYVDQVSDLRAYGGVSLHQQSHGESFLALFVNRFEQGLYVLDEPEAALSPQRQLSFLRLIHQLETSGHAQFLVSTHSPILLAYPGAVLLSLDGPGITRGEYTDTEHYRLTRDFLGCPERYFRHLFAPDDEEGGAPRKR